jgi:hypothetical protein
LPTKLPPHPSNLTATGIQMITGAVVQFIIGQAMGEHVVLATTTSASWLALGYLAVFGSLIGFTCYGWLLFRETHLARLVQYHKLLPWVATPDQWVASAVLLVTIVIVAAPMVLALAFERYAMPRLERSPWLLPMQTTIWAVYAVLILSFVRTGNNDFIYFQF